MEETLNMFIQFNMDNRERNDKRLDSLEASMKRLRHKWARLLSSFKDTRKGSFQANLNR